MTKLLQTIIVLLLLILPTLNTYANSTEICEDFSNNLKAHGNIEGKKLYLELNAKALAVEDKFRAELDKLESNSHLDRKELVNALSDFLKHAPLGLVKAKDDNSFHFCVKMENIQWANDINSKFQPVNIAKICDYDKQLWKQHKEAFETDFITSLQKQENYPGISSMLNDSGIIKGKPKAELVSLLRKDDFVDISGGLREPYKCTTFSVLPIELYAMSSPKPVTPGVKTVSMGTHEDKKGKIGNYDLIILHKKFTWKFESVDALENKKKPVTEQFKTLIRDNDFIKLVKTSRDVISVGMASCEAYEGIAIEEKRARNRAKQVKKWLSDMFKEKGINDIPLYSLNLGIYTGKCEGDTAETSTQRRILLIGVSRNSDTEVDVERTLNKAMRDESPVKLPINPDKYSKFELFDMPQNIRKYMNTR